MIILLLEEYQQNLSNIGYKVSKPIKLLTIIETLGKGGAERVLVNTLPELQKHGVECEVAILFDRDDLAAELESQGIKVHRLHLSYKWNIIEGIFKLNKLLKSNKYDIVHAHLFFAHFYVPLALPFDYKIKKVVTFHNLGFNEYPANTFIKRIRKKLEEYIVKKFDRKTAVSKAVQEHYMQHLRLKHVKIIHNSFPIKEFEQYKKDRQDNKCFSVLTPGRLVPEKGHKFLLEAIEILNKKKLNMHFYIIGDGPLKKNIEDFAKLQPNVTYQHAIPHSKLMKLYRNMDLIVIPSINEAFGLVVGEAMIMETPIVASNIDGIVEILENNKEGLLVPPRNSDALAEAIEKLYKDRTLQKKFLINAKEKIKQFDTKIVSMQWFEFYEEMLNG